MKIAVLPAVTVMAVLLSGSCSVERAVEREAVQPLSEVGLLRHPETGREVIFVPMRHMGSRERYDATRQYLDTLKRRGWVIFHEGVAAVPFHVDTVNDLPLAILFDTLGMYLTRADRPRFDTMMRKCRRMLGYMVNRCGYADTANLSLKSDVSLRRRYISQNSELLGATTDRDIWCDYSLADAIEVCERRYGEIHLTDYDFTTGLYEKYEPEERADGRARNYFTLHARNDYVVRRIRTSRHQRIAVVYGSSHSFGIIWRLKKHGGYRLVRSYDAAADVTSD